MQMEICNQLKLRNLTLKTKYFFMHIASNSFDKEIILKNYELNEISLGDYINDFEKGENLIIRGICNRALENLNYAGALKLEAKKVKYYVNLFAEASLVKYQMATHAGVNITASFLEKKYQITAPDKNYTVSDQGWSKSYMAALACRRMDIVHSLCEIDLDVVQAKTKTTGGIYSLLFAKFLQRLFKKAESHGQNLLAAANEIKKDKMPDSTYEYALHIDGPVIDIFTPLLMKDENDFNAMLLNAFELHKSYWANQQANLADGLISIPLTAMAVMAKDYDFKIEHTSDYIIQSLVDN